MFKAEQIGAQAGREPLYCREIRAVLLYDHGSARERTVSYGAFDDSAQVKTREYARRTFKGWNVGARARLDKLRNIALT